MPESVKQIEKLLRDPLSSRRAPRIGIEVERFGFWSDGQALRYQASDRWGAGNVLKALSQIFSLEPVLNDGGDLLGLHHPQGKVSLEPGSQLEFAANPVSTVGELSKVLDAFDRDLNRATQGKNLTWLSHGTNPSQAPDDLDVIPLPRYAIMTKYLSARGKLATSMMRLTTSIQLNFDYASEKEGIEMLRVALAVAPHSYALFGNSPFYCGSFSGFLSFRGEIWRHTDSERAGLLPFVFESDFDFKAYSAWAAGNPLMFARGKNDGPFLETGGKSLFDIENGRLSGATVDGENTIFALREVFPEARLKPGYVEVRSIDGLPQGLRESAAAFWLGLMYSEDARRKALELLKDRGPVLDAKWTAASRDGFSSEKFGRQLLTETEVLLSLSRKTLEGRGHTEAEYLARVEKILNSRKNPGALLLEKIPQWDLSRFGDFLETAKFSA